MDSFDPFNQFNDVLRSSLPDVEKSAPLPDSAPLSTDLVESKKMHAVSTLSPAILQQEVPIDSSGSSHIVNGGAKVINDAGSFSMNQSQVHCQREPFLQNGGDKANFGLGSNPLMTNASSGKLSNCINKAPGLPKSTIHGPIEPQKHMQQMEQYPGNKPAQHVQVAWNMEQHNVNPHNQPHNNEQSSLVTFDRAASGGVEYASSYPLDTANYGAQFNSKAPPPAEFNAATCSASTPSTQNQGQWGPPPEKESNLSFSGPSADDDPFGLFGTGEVDEALGAGSEQTMSKSVEDKPSPPSKQGLNPKKAIVQSSNSTDTCRQGLPAGGKVYDTKVFARRIGVVFFRPQDLTDSLFSEANKELVDALKERPVAAFVSDVSCANEAGIKLGHVLLKVNGIDARNPKEAGRLIADGPRPLSLSLYVPNTAIAVAEAMCMAKYDTGTVLPPCNTYEWKPKYVVVGGIISKPRHINMYRSRAEYETAVMEVLSHRHKLSVKVKQFRLDHGSQIYTDRTKKNCPAVRVVKYQGFPKPWSYIVVQRPRYFPIKIASSSADDLDPIVKAIRRGFVVRAAEERSFAGLRRMDV